MRCFPANFPLLGIREPKTELDKHAGQNPQLIMKYYTKILTKPKILLQVDNMIYGAWIIISF